MSYYKRLLKVAIYIVLILLVVFLFTFPLMISEIWNAQLGHKSTISVMIDSVVDGIKNGEKYDKYAQDYFKDKFGGIASSNIKMLSGYRVSDNKFSYAVKFDSLFNTNIYIYSDFNGNCSDNLSEVLSTDPKFQHLYSEWVKKQVGIEDENVELEFAGNFDKPYIEFDKITNLSDDYREVFENTHNLYAWMCKVKNIEELNNNNKLEIAEMVRINYLQKMMTLTGIAKDKKKYYAGHINLSTGNFDKNNDINFKFRYDARVENCKLEELD